MDDQYGRNIDYLRISVTDRCNFRCRYCMPEEGINFVSHGQIMTYEEILRVCRIGAQLGIRKVKITGGEPLVRKGVCGLIGKIRSIQGISSVTITTNGSLLSRYLPEMKKAGVTGINVSLDTLNKDRFARMTGRDCFTDVMDGIQEAVQSGIQVKINCVPVQGFNEDEQALIERELIRLADNRQVNLIVTTGGTGFSKRDCTPEATMAVATRNAPGIAEVIRAYSMTITGRAMLGRGVSVIRNGTLIVNLPGSRKAVKESLEHILPHLEHGIEILAGDTTECGGAG